MKNFNNYLKENMKPTKKKIMDDMIDYNDMISYIEEKYNIDTRDYLRKFDTNDKQIEQYNKTVKGKAKITGSTQYTSQEYKDFESWRKKNNLPSIDSIKYLDYWHWLLNHSWEGLNNGSAKYLDVVEILEDEETATWVKEITQLIHDEFKDDLDSSGGLTVWVEW